MKFCLLLLSCFMAGAAEAAVFKCTDSEGNVKYWSKPCGDGEKNVEINVKTGGRIDQSADQGRRRAEQQAEAEKARSEQEASLKRRQLAADAARESALNQSFIKRHPDRYSAYAIAPYRPEQLPSAAMPYRDRLPEIERLRREASERALQGGRCRRVESSELNARSSAEALVFLIDCSSGKQFYISEKELAHAP